MKKGISSYESLLRKPHYQIKKKYREKLELCNDFVKYVTKQIVV